MAKVTVNESSLENIGDAIRAQLEVDTEYKPSQMAAAIRSIEKADLESLSATVNGTYLPTSGHNGFDRAVVNVPNSYGAGDEGKVVNNGALVSQTSVTKTANGTYDTTLNDEVVINVPQGTTPTGNINITDMQQTDVSAYATAQVVDADLVAGNIKKDVDILGVVGTYEGSGGGDSGCVLEYSVQNTTYGGYGTEAAASSVTATLLDAVAGYTAVMVIMHRGDVPTVPSSWEHVYTTNDGWQFVSIYKKKITQSGSESVSITFSSSVRYAVMFFTFNQDIGISNPTKLQANTGEINISVPIGNSLRFLVFSSGYNAATSYRYWLERQAIGLPEQIGKESNSPSIARDSRFFVYVVDSRSNAFHYRRSVSSGDDQDNAWLYLFEISAEEVIPSASGESF